MASFANAAGVGSGGESMVGGNDLAPQVAVGADVGARVGCTALAFRTGAGAPLMAAAGGAGGVP